MMRLKAFVFAGAAVLAMAAPAVAQTNAAKGNTPPSNNPSELRETFESWTVRCVLKDAGRDCNMAHQQRHRETHQLVLAIELKKSANAGLGGILVLPFGLRLAKGITMQIDDSATPLPLQFSTCMPVGCLVPLSLDKQTIATLRAGTVLKISAVPNEDNKPVTLSVSLKGFAQGLDRLTALGS
jgi:invasion protein IalB